MQSLPFDPQTVLLLMGILSLVMPLTTWSILVEREAPGVLALWCAGGLLSGAGLLLLGLRSIAPDVLTYLLANALLYAGLPLRYAALCRHRGQAIPWLWLTGLLLAAIASYEVAAWWGERWRVSISHMVLACGAAAVGHIANTVGRERTLRTARMVGDCYSLLAATEFLRFVLIATGLAASEVVNAGFDAILALVAGMLVAIYSNLGYVGMALERAQMRAHQRLNELQASRTEGKQAVQESAELRELLAEREEMLRLLAHEVRQPLHNASAALQSADATLAAAAGSDPAAAARIARGQQVISQVNATLDNTLAAAALLASEGRIARRDSDIETLLQMSIGDLDPSARHRVRVERHSPTRTAAMDASLMRLALRNLLSNALAHSPDDTPVTVHVSDSDDPLALVIEVCDEGSGIAADLRPRLFQRGARGTHSQTGHGLGLYIVRRVMEMHGGVVEQHDNQPRGTVFRMSIPQDLAP